MSEVAENVVTDNTEVDFSAEVETDTENKLDIPEEVVQAFTSGKEDNKEEEAILISMLQAGSPFAKVRGYYKKLMIAAGLDISQEDKDAVLAQVFDGTYDVATEEGFDAAVAKVDELIDVTNERGAAQMVRGYARKHNLEFFKKPKAEPTGTRVAFTNDFYMALVNNPQMSEKECHDYIVEHGSESTLKSEKAYQKIRILANEISNKYLN